MSTTRATVGRPGIARDLRLLRIEVRRNVTIMLSPFLVVIAGLMIRDELSKTIIAIWPHSSMLVQELVALFGPAMAGACAWTASRERRRSIDDLVAITPRPAMVRHLHAWAGTLIWGFAAYALAGAFVFGYTYLKDAWGGPDWWPILTGAAAIALYSAIGYAVGALIPSRFAPPLVAAASFLSIAFLANAYNAAALFSPVTTSLSNPSDGIWYGLGEEYLPARFLFFALLTGAVLGALAVGLRRTLASSAFLLGCGGAAVAVAVLMVARGAGSVYDDDYQTRRVLPYTPVCSGTPLPVCMHPAYGKQLPRVARSINQVASPLVGVAGMSARAEQVPWTLYDPSALPTEGRLTFMWEGSKYESGDMRYAIAAALAGKNESGAVAPGQEEQPRNAARDALQTWLLARVGWDYCHPSNELSPEDRTSCRAAERFGKLSASEQRRWLNGHYADLRAGKLGLEDLP